MCCVIITVSQVQCTYLQLLSWYLAYGMFTKSPWIYYFRIIFNKKKITSKNFIVTKHFIIQFKHTFWNVKFYSPTHMRLKLFPTKRNPGFNIKSCPSPAPTFLYHSLSALWEQGLCHLWFIKAKETERDKESTRQVSSWHFLWLPVVRGFIPRDVTKWQSFRLDKNT